MSISNITPKILDFFARLFRKNNFLKFRHYYFFAQPAFLPAVFTPISLLWRMNGRYGLHAHFWVRLTITCTYPILTALEDEWQIWSPCTFLLVLTCYLKKNEHFTIELTWYHGNLLSLLHHGRDYENALFSKSYTVEQYKQAVKFRVYTKVETTGPVAYSMWVIPYPHPL